jgi:hypothetical protein
MRSFFYGLILALIFFPRITFSQSGYVNNAVVIDGDTISYISLAPFYVVDHTPFKNKKDEIRYTRLVRYVKIAYPYARIAGEKLQKYDSLLQNTPTERERKKIMKNAEDEIRAEYEGKLRSLTIGQGKILVKLIDRQTNHSSYALLQELRGSVNAVLWQGVGRIFGYNLKIKYDPTGEDREIERIVRLIEIGAI